MTYVGDPTEDLIEIHWDVHLFCRASETCKEWGVLIDRIETMFKTDISFTGTVQWLEFSELLDVKEQKMCVTILLGNA